MRENLEIEIATEMGKLAVLATYRRACWASVYYRGKWSVTHVPSGRAVTFRASQEDAERVTKKLGGYLPFFRLSLKPTTEKVFQLGRDPEDQALAAFIKQLG